MRLCNVIYLCALAAIQAGCGTNPVKPSDKHIQQQDSQPAVSVIPETIKRPPPLPPPKPVVDTETYSVVVTDLPAREILFALARDAKINLDIHPGIRGNVTLNALNQTLPQILARISKQIDMRYELDNGNLLVMADAPFLKHYKIDYVNMTRDAESSIVTSAQVASTGAATVAAGTTNNSLISIKNISRNHFWVTLEQNIRDILRETDKEIIAGRRGADRTPSSPVPSDVTAQSRPVAQAGGDAAEKHSVENDYRNYQTLLAASVISNPENSLITVRATSRQHEKIQEFVDRIMNNARRQVMIEATIVEVNLSDNYQQGINWSALTKAGGKQFKLVQSSAGLPTGVGNGIFGIITNPTPASIASQVSLLQSFGDVKVLSSPKLSVLNNQTALIKVVDNLVYFTVGTNIVTNQTGSTTTYNTEPKTIPVGFTMSVTPQISDSDVVLLNLKPSISRVIGFVNDPNPDLARAGVVSRIPQTQTREMESIMKIDDNQIAVMGGLMQDEVNRMTDAIPGLSKLPGAGELFKQRNDVSAKTELVIFLRPQVIKDASLSGDFSRYSDMLPDRDFFKEPFTP
ncbi:MAG: pilus (MSHA type) biogenesis protein MshL [Gallionella sp.]|nr:pilus (MSHA type) biogenesis protein MshL [Gallionella sp.]